jgi:hypothetical protein
MITLRVPLPAQKIRAFPAVAVHLERALQDDICFVRDQVWQCLRQWPLQLSGVSQHGVTIVLEQLDLSPDVRPAAGYQWQLPARVLQAHVCVRPQSHLAPHEQVEAAIDAALERATVALIERYQAALRDVRAMARWN